MSWKDKCAELQAEIDMLREANAAAVFQEQLSRAEANRLRAELNALKKKLAVPVPPHRD